MMGRFEAPHPSSPTIAQLSDRIARLGTDASVDAEDVCVILESIGELTDEEVAALMQEDASE